MTLNQMELLVIYLLKIESKSVQSSVYRYIIDTITSNAKYLCFDYYGKLFMVQKILIYLQWALKLMLNHEKNV